MSDPFPSSLRHWLAFAAGLGLAAVAVALSTALSEATHLVFHFHPIAIAAGSAWIYRRLEGERPCATRSVAFLLGLAALLSASERSLGPRGLSDSPPLAAAIWLVGLATAGSILLRQARPSSASAEPLR